MTRISYMLDWDSRKKLASTSSAIYNLVFHRGFKHKAPARQDQDATSTAKVSTRTARKNLKLRKHTYIEHCSLTDNLLYEC